MLSQSSWAEAGTELGNFLWIMDWLPYRDTQPGVAELMLEDVCVREVRLRSFLLALLIQKLFYLIRFYRLLCCDLLHFDIFLNFRIVLIFEVVFILGSSLFLRLSSHLRFASFFRSFSFWGLLHFKVIFLLRPFHFLMSPSFLQLTSFEVVFVFELIFMELSLTLKFYINKTWDHKNI